MYNSDVGLLKTAIVHTPGKEISKVIILTPDDHPALPVDYIGVNAIKEHRNFLRLLSKNNVNIVQLLDLLNKAIDILKQNEQWSNWLQSSFNTSCMQKLASASITAEDLIGISDRGFYNRNPVTGRLEPIFSPQKWMFFCRDFAAMTPQGLILCNFINRQRREEAIFARLIFEHLEPFSSFSIVLDGPEEGIAIQGGDIIIQDKNTLLLGVNNLSEKRAARILAQRLAMRVIAVNLPPAISIKPNTFDVFTPANLLFLHLDSVFTIVDSNKFVVAPYWFERSFGRSDPLEEILLGLMPGGAAQKNIIAQMSDVGWITIYHAKTGKEEIPRLKLVDFLKLEGYSPIYVGGEKRRNNVHKHFMERVIPELRFQASNILALKPGEVIAYAGNQRFTLSAMRDNGIIVHTFESHELVRWEGGPHCLALPIERE